MSSRSLLLAGCLLLAVAHAANAHDETKQTRSAKRVLESTKAFLATLDDKQREQVSFKYDDPERLNWHFIPRERRGLALKDTEGDARTAAYQLIASGLSESGNHQARDVMSLEEVLFLLEGGEREARRQRRDPENYYISVFGEPVEDGTWGFRVEGHHLSLNYTIENGRIAASTPEFFGANPAQLSAGPNRARQVLGPEEEVARKLYKSLSPEQRKTALIDPTPPDDVDGAGATQPKVADPIGIAMYDLNEEQQRTLQELVREYLANMPDEVRDERYGRIEKAGTDKIHFAWWGGENRGEGHHYRVQGPTFLIEYNNTQDNANHIHSMWRDLEGDFNLPIAE